MPNWCSNRLNIFGSPENIQEFLNTTKDNKLSFSQTVPMPDILKNIQSGHISIDNESYSVWREVDGKTIPISDSEMDDIKKVAGSTNWYDWNIENWGTKWDIDDVFDYDEDRISCIFDTAWSPPIEWLTTVSKKFPNLSFELHYCEGGCDFYGSAFAENGEVENNTYNGVYGDFPEDEDFDPNDYLSPDCRAHIEEHGLHTGG